MQVHRTEPPSSPGNGLSRERGSGENSIQDWRMQISMHLVARPISSFVETFLMIQFLQAVMRPSS